jgi:pyrroline-5-carboxylate reductase
MYSGSIGFWGAGQMARALARGFVAAKQIAPENVVAFDPVPEALTSFEREVPGSQAAASNEIVAQQAQTVFLATKPQHSAAVFVQLRGKLPPEKLVVSIVAGIPLAKLAEGLGTDRIVRVMPNTPALVGYGASAYALGGGATAEDGKWVASLLGSVGLAYQVDERLLDAVTGLSGSGPAFVYLVIEALADGGVRMGLSRDVALALAAQTVRGAATMVLETHEHPAVLKDRVASPGGTTIAGLAALESHGLRGALIDAVEVATLRSKELGN